uniref:Uncharacterized protein n=1 Tax=Streptomyces pratensis (strain ATCC 33331 / IAF-45CD) TaxID=591167 RepID=A0A8D3WNE2_STRFA
MILHFASPDPLGRWPQGFLGEAVRWTENPVSSLRSWDHAGNDRALQAPTEDREFCGEPAMKLL